MQTVSLIERLIYKIRMPLVLLMLFTNHNTFSQKGYFNVKISYSIVGSTSQLKKGMTASGYGDQPSGSWVIFGPPRDYPYGEKYPSIYVEYGKYINENRSFSLMAGLEEPGKLADIAAQLPTTFT